MKIPKIQDRLTYVPLRIESYFGETKLSIGTAFFFEQQDKPHFVTNWHNVTGRNPNTLFPLHPEAALPDRLCLYLPYQGRRKDGTTIFEWKQKTMRLYEDDARQIPKWWEHPEFGNRVDVVAITFESLEDTAIVPANSNQLDLSNISLYPSLDAFILGFPKGISGGGRFPIWKRATLASEPDIDLDGVPKLFVDTATREGMSGAPVYVQEVGCWLPEGETSMTKAVLGKGRRFLGIYSGRVGDDEFQAQMGVVWKVEAIDKVIEGKSLGRSSFELYSENGA